MSSTMAPKTGPRSTTATLLGDAYVPEPSFLPNVPLPVPAITVQGYTTPRLKSALSWIDQRIRSTSRKPCPLSHKALLVYKDVCCEALEITNEEQRKRLIVTIRAFERSLNWEGRMFRGAANAEDQTLQDQIMGFKRLEFNNRYGGYVANLCTQLGIQPTKLTLGGFDLLAEPWITIKDEIGHETSRLECYASSLYPKLLYGRVRPPTKTSDAVYRASREAGLDPNLTLFSIRQYAGRNEIPHSSVDDVVKAGILHSLAFRLSRDLDDLPRIVPPEDAEAERHMRAVIQAMILEWFPRAREHPDHPGAWGGNNKLIHYYRILTGEVQTVQGVRDEEWGKVAARARACKAAEESEDEIASQAKRILARGDAVDVSARSMKDCHDARVTSFDILVSIHRAADAATTEDLEYYGHLDWPRKVLLPWEQRWKESLMLDDPDRGGRPTTVGVTSHISQGFLP
jgi:hypothetical protein